MELNDLLRLHDVQPAETVVMRHRPREPELRRVFAWIAAERPELYDAFQCSHGDATTRMLLKARWLLSCVGQSAGAATFVGLYRITGHSTMSKAAYWRMPEHRELRSLGMDGPSRTTQRVVYFRVDAHDSFYPHWRGRLVLDWPGGERAWVRWSARNRMPVQAIHPESQLVAERPDWEQMVLRWHELQVLPSSWRSALREWRGIYLIVDETDGRTYVGSACGDENLLGRWLSYARTGHGGNRELRGRKPENFRFSILQRLSPDTPRADAIHVETSWKERLATREFGLNAN